MQQQHHKKFAKSFCSYMSLWWWIQLKWIESDNIWIRCVAVVVIVEVSQTPNEWDKVTQQNENDNKNRILFVRFRLRVRSFVHFFNFEFDDRWLPV